MTWIFLCLYFMLPNLKTIYAIEWVNLNILEKHEFLF